MIDEINAEQLNETIEVLKRVSSVEGYFELKNYSLKKALTYRFPLSVEEGKELRIYYSQYFSGLLSATGLLLEKEYKHKENFEKILYENFIFENASNGKQNYLYLHELRNSLIHRGRDITQSAHSLDNFPMIVAPKEMKSRNGKEVYNKFSYYLINLIINCESVIGNIFLKHFEECEIINLSIPKEKSIELCKEFILEENSVPDEFLEVAFKMLDDVDHNFVQKEKFKQMCEFLKTKTLDEDFKSVTFTMEESRTQKK